jgi:hypothetical protein
MAVPPAKSPVGEIFRLFLRQGLTAFGGPAAHIGLMQQDAVERRRWLSLPGNRHSPPRHRLGTVPFQELNHGRQEQFLVLSLKF